MDPSRLLCPWDSPDKNTGVGCHFLLQIHYPKSFIYHIICVYLYAYSEIMNFQILLFIH